MGMLRNILLPELREEGGAMMETVDKLRDANVLLTWENGTLRANELADEIEREIAERYMELPLDADGVPIHVGDEMEHGEYGSVFVDAVAPCGISVFKQNGFTLWAPAFKPDAWHHFKPRTVEDVLEEFADEVRRCCDSKETLGKYADELREMMGV